MAAGGWVQVGGVLMERDALAVLDGPPVDYDYGALERKLLNRHCDDCGKATTERFNARCADLDPDEDSLLCTGCLTARGLALCEGCGNVKRRSQLSDGFCRACDSY